MSIITFNSGYKFATLIKNNWPHFILGGLNYYVLTFKLIIRYNALIVYIHVLHFTCLHVITSVIQFCNYIYNYTLTHPLHLNPLLNIYIYI